MTSVDDHEQAVDERGWVRTMPFHLTHEEPRLSGLDGFFAARLRVG